MTVGRLQPHGNAASLGSLLCAQREKFIESGGKIDGDEDETMLVALIERNFNQGNGPVDCFLFALFIGFRHLAKDIPAR
ncbi:hypothetical protein [Erythrobacter fulvus]|uniref:hypothetical protein n=1 Tax=Erythrobacter fulvus TaxID=2987523 RepID=UPI00235906E3|nr:hypothetical protein [Erythrobacter fulvus]